MPHAFLSIAESGDVPACASYRASTCSMSALSTPAAAAAGASAVAAFDVSTTCATAAVVVGGAAVARLLDMPLCRNYRLLDPSWSPRLLSVGASSIDSPTSDPDQFSSSCTKQLLRQRYSEWNGGVSVVLIRIVGLSNIRQVFPPERFVCWQGFLHRSGRYAVITVKSSRYADVRV